MNKKQVKPSNFIKHTSAGRVKRFFIDRFNAALIKEILAAGPVASILDAGCGEGFCLNLIRKSGIKAVLTGVDNSQEALRLGKSVFPRLDLRKGNLYRLDFPDRSFDMVVCTEVLEHLTDPQKALHELARVARKVLILSVPHEPLFMLGNFFHGKYLTRLGNHPEHINHWTAMSFTRFLRSNDLKIIRVTYPFPLILAVVRLGD